MQVELSESLLSTQDGKRAKEILRRCVHCGFCNTTCPTYNLLGNELDGPRGRIYLMKEMLESEHVADDAVHHLDRCLTCRSCETTCPSGVEYGDLLEIGRRYVKQHKPQSTLIERLLLSIVPFHRRLKLMVQLGRLFRWILPMQLKRMLQPIKRSHVQESTGSSEVTLLQGCVQRVMTPEVTEHLGNLLSDRGVKATIRERETCCGGLHLHLGYQEEAERIMSSYIDSLSEPNVDSETFISSASGCGVTVKSYGNQLQDSRASTFANRTQDVCEYLSKFSFEKHPNIQRVALHNPCTLQHGQQLRGHIEEILTNAGYELVPVANGHLCCGSAGTYSILQPELSEQLLDRKVASLQAHTPDVIATANVGCQMHLSTSATVRVMHWVSLLR